MSATNRGTEREVTDFYSTPAFCVHALHRAGLPLPGGNWLDPCAGAGAIPTAYRQLRQDINWWGCELRYDLKPWLDWTFAPGQSMVGDFLQHPNPGRYDVICTNFPYSIAEEFLVKCLPLADWVVVLLRLNFLGSGRYDLLSKEMPDTLTLSNRPGFRKVIRVDPETGKKSKSGSDATEYAWFVWGPERGRTAGSNLILPPMSLEERRVLNASIPQHIFNK